MQPTATIAIFDIGKTNKKLVLFDEQYKIVIEKTAQLKETTDEDGFPCEDISALTQWMQASLEWLLGQPQFDIRAINISAYGASLVYLDKNLEVCLPVYNYMKPYPQDLQKKFYADHGGESLLARQTASPVLGSLNSGLQLYRLKYEKPEEFKKIKWALHLPQYLSFIFSSSAHSEITSIGCHTHLWDFEKKEYHEWVRMEQTENLFPPIVPSTIVAGYFEKIPVGAGMHDSSAALIPYIASFAQPFILISTGTWCISLNPFNHSPLTELELKQDCLCYLSYEAMPVKASRLFAGYVHEQEVKKIAAKFNKPLDYYKEISYDPSIFKKMNPGGDQFNPGEEAIPQSRNYEEAYYQLMREIVRRQEHSTRLLMKEQEISRIFVDGGFSQNVIYMKLLAETFPGIEVYAASEAQATACGAALAMHSHWNKQPIPTELIELKYYASNKTSVKN